MHCDNKDFYGHPRRLRLSPWLYVPALGLLSIALAALWADTNHAATWRANGIAEQQAGKLSP